MLPYRKNVAAFILKDNLILTCQRADGNLDWQLPQGGIDENESPDQALSRELKEEVFLENFSILSQIPYPITYDWPKELHKRGFSGQEQYFYAVTPTNQNWKPIFDLHHQIEFKDYRWLSSVEFTKLVENTFRASSYLKALKYFKEKNPNLIV